MEKLWQDHGGAVQPATPVVRSDGGMTLLGGGPLLPQDLGQALAVAPTLVAADSGADQALAQGRLPAAVIGDMDSISDEARKALPPDRLYPIDEQETTDFEKCLMRIDARFVLALGFLGGRIDHALAVFSTLARWPGPPLILVGAEDVVLAAPPRITLDLPLGSRLSLFPMAAVRGRSAGLRWPIDGIDFAPAGRIGTSNEVTGAVRLELEAPGMLIILPRQGRDAVLAALECG